jgi:hypothetical protein
MSNIKVDFNPFAQWQQETPPPLQKYGRLQFRGKTKLQNGKPHWIHGGLVEDREQNRTFLGHYDFKRSEFKMEEVYPGTVGQFTEIYAFNADGTKTVELCEGDIVENIIKNSRDEIESTGRGLVIYWNGGWLIQDGLVTNGLQTMPRGYPLMDVPRFERTIDLKLCVIGNIHDNAELFKPEIINPTNSKISNYE